MSVTEQTARLLATPDVVVSYEDAQALLYEWLNNIGLGQHLSSFLDAGYDSPVLLAGITEAVSCGFEIVYLKGTGGKKTNYIGKRHCNELKFPKQRCKN